MYIIYYQRMNDDDFELQIINLIEKIFFFWRDTMTMLLGCGTHVCDGSHVWHAWMDACIHLSQSMHACAAMQPA